MTEVQTLPPVLRTVTVARPIEAAFSVFTDQLGAWWPLQVHSVDNDRAVGATMEGRVGGRIYEIWDDGQEREWGRMLVWDPPHRIVFSWKPNQDAVIATEVEVRFEADGTSTQVELEHRGWERLGEAAEEARSGYAAGWPGTLDLYVAAT